MALERGDVMIGQDRLVVEQCPTCAVVYAIPEALKERGLRYRGKVSIYCPNGHTWHYMGRTHAQELEELRDRIARERALRDQADASANGYRAAATRARNERDKLKERVEAGVCPHCHRTFKQLAKHMKSKHPEEAHEPSGHLT
jgi:hypothetical protein